jgi:hypothetical protein
MGRVGRLVAVAAMVTTVCAGAGLSAFAADAPPRNEYVAALEEICKPGGEATQRAMKGVKKDVDAGRIALAARKFGRAAEIFGETVDAIARVPRPPADAARLKKWFGYLGRQENYLKEITAQLRARRTIKAQRLTARFIHNGNLANNAVLAFGFNHCSFRFSRFG